MGIKRALSYNSRGASQCWVTVKCLLASFTAVSTGVVPCCCFSAAVLSSSTEESTYGVEGVPASPNRCWEEAGVAAPAAAAATNLSSTKFKMKCLVKGEIFLTPGIVHSGDQRLYWAPSTVENVQQSNLAIESKQKTRAGKVVSDRNITTVSKTTWLRKAQH